MATRCKKVAWECEAHLIVVIVSLILSASAIAMPPRKSRLSPSKSKSLLAKLQRRVVQHRNDRSVVVAVTKIWRKVRAQSKVTKRMTRDSEELLDVCDSPVEHECVGDRHATLGAKPAVRQAARKGR